MTAAARKAGYFAATHRGPWWAGAWWGARPAPWYFEFELRAWLAARLGAAVYPLYRPQAIPLPALTYQATDMTTHHVLRGASGLNKVSVQFTAWSKDYADCLRLAEGLRNALDGYRGPVGRARVLSSLRVRELPLYNEPADSGDQGVFQRVMLYDLWYAEPLPTGA